MRLLAVGLSVMMSAISLHARAEDVPAGLCDHMTASGSTASEASRSSSNDMILDLEIRTDNDTRGVIYLPVREVRGLDEESQAIFNTVHSLSPQDIETLSQAGTAVDERSAGDIQGAKMFISLEIPKFSADKELIQTQISVLNSLVKQRVELSRDRSRILSIDTDFAQDPLLLRNTRSIADNDNVISKTVGYASKSLQKVSLLRASIALHEKLVSRVLARMHGVRTRFVNLMAKGGQTSASAAAYSALVEKIDLETVADLELLGMIRQFDAIVGAYERGLSEALRAEKLG